MGGDQLHIRREYGTDSHTGAVGRPALSLQPAGRKRLEDCLCLSGWHHQHFGGKSIVRVKRSQVLP